MTILHARQVTTQEPGAALDVALRQSPLAAIGFDHFSDVDLRFLFRHGFPQLKEYLSG
jgi:hypothetical protein